MKDFTKTWLRGWFEMLWKVTLYWWISGAVIILSLLGFSKFQDIKKKIGRK